MLNKKTMYELFFQNLAKHIHLEPFEKHLIENRLQTKTVSKNDVLLQAGAYCRNIYFVTKGCLRIFQNHPDGSETSVLFCPKNWWACDIISFSQGLPSVYSIEALEDTEINFISSTHLEELYNELPKLERFFRILFQNGFALYQARLTLALSSSAEVRYALFRKQYPTLMNRIAQKHIASYLGITPVFLSIIRKR